MMISIIQMFQLSGCLIQSLEGDIYGVLQGLLLSFCPPEVVLLLPRASPKSLRAPTSSSNAEDPDVLRINCWVKIEDVSFLSEVVKLIN